MRIVAITILVADFSIATMDHDFSFLLKGNLPRPLNGGLLGGMMRRVFLGVVASHGPTIFSVHYMLVWHTSVSHWQGTVLVSIPQPIETRLFLSH